MKQAKIFSIIFMPQVQQYVVILEELGGTRLLPIWIGVNEGNSIALFMEKQKLPRPLSHDLFVTILNTLSVKVEKVVISDLKDNIYYAMLHIKLNGKQYPIDARPSDSMCISVRTNAPIFIEEKVLEKCPVIRKPISNEEVDEFKAKLQNLRPEDFFREHM
jgi:bifunctional DNase/RNase